MSIKTPFIVIPVSLLVGVLAVACSEDEGRPASLNNNSGVVAGGSSGQATGGTGDVGGTAGEAGAAGEGGEGGTAGDAGAAGEGGAAGAVEPEKECTLESGNAGCDNCVITVCNTRCVRCEEAPDCAGAIDCIMDACYDDTGAINVPCVQACVNAIPDEADRELFYGLMTCANESCPGFCPVQTQSQP